jgi:hypothetical protein
MYVCKKMARQASKYYLYYYNYDKTEHQLKLWSLEEERKHRINKIRENPHGSSIKKYVQELNMINRHIVKMRSYIVPLPPNGKYCMECELLYSPDVDIDAKVDGFCSKKCCSTYNNEMAAAADETFDP